MPLWLIIVATSIITGAVSAGITSYVIWHLAKRLRPLLEPTHPQTNVASGNREELAVSILSLVTGLRDVTQNMSHTLSIQKYEPQDDKWEEVSSHLSSYRTKSRIYFNDKISDYLEDLNLFLLDAKGLDAKLGSNLSSPQTAVEELVLLRAKLADIDDKLGREFKQLLAV